MVVVIMQNEEQCPPVKQWRAALPQFLATTAKNTLMFNVGIMTGFVMVVIGEIRNPDSGLSFNNEQISWFSSVLSICNPVGSLFSGLLVGRLGSKRAMLLSNIPFAAVWLCFYWGETPAVLLSALVVAGFSYGLSEGPTKSYAGEICQPALRGALLTYSCLFIFSGILFASMLSEFLPWRDLALVSTAVPIVSFFSILLIPESPFWLVNKGRKQEAEAALCWLRGWVHPSVVAHELGELIRYHKHDMAKRRRSSTRAGNEAGDGGGVTTMIRMLLAPETLRPWCLLLVVLTLSSISRGGPMSMFVIQVYRELQLPLGPHTTLSLGALLALFSIMLSSFLIARLGVRFMSLVSALGAGLCYFLIGCYTYWGWHPWLAQILVFSTTLFSVNGLFQLPWILISEIFPFRTRAIASGISAALFHVIFSLLNYSFLPVESAVGLSGVLWIFAFAALPCAALIYWFVPETTGRTLMEIETLFSAVHSSSSSDMHSLATPKIVGSAGSAESIILMTKQI